LTAVTLATWSPGYWCCCNAEATDAVADMAPAVETDSCCAAADEAPVVVQTPDDCDADTCCPVDPSRQPTCGCLHASADVVLPAVTSLPGHGKSADTNPDLLAELPSAVAGISTRVRLGIECRGSPRRPCAQTLLALHCQLTT
jgi:hypothetical protein